VTTSQRQQKSSGQALLASRMVSKAEESDDVEPSGNEDSLDNEPSGLEDSADNIEQNKDMFFKFQFMAPEIHEYEEEYELIQIFAIVVKSSKKVEIPPPQYQEEIVFWDI
jgi:hypothetical protein